MLDWSELADWARVRLNRPQADVQESTFWNLYAGPALDTLQGPTPLLCVITTYRRPEACRALIASLRAALGQREAWLLVLNDHADADYSEARAEAVRAFGPRLAWLDARARIGKPGFWKAYQVAFLAAARLQPEYTLFLQDDLELAADFFVRVHEQWSALASDALRRVLYLFSSAEDERFGRWTLALRRDVAPGLRRTQWFDLQAFFVDRAFFELLQYRIVPIHPNRWRRKPTISSGVGKQLTNRLRLRANVYQSYPPLVFHGALCSEMNPDARAVRALDNRDLAVALAQPKQTRLDPDDR